MGSQIIWHITCLNHWRHNWWIAYDYYCEAFDMVIIYIFIKGVQLYYMFSFWFNVMSLIIFSLQERKKNWFYAFILIQWHEIIFQSFIIHHMRHLLIRTLFGSLFNCFHFFIDKNSQLVRFLSINILIVLICAWKLLKRWTWIV